MSEGKTMKGLSEVDKIKHSIGDLAAEYVLESKCDHCKKKAIVFSCAAKNSQEPKCPNKYCRMCLDKFYNEDIMKILRAKYGWVCPSHRGICYCSKCVETQGIDNLHEKIKSKLKKLIHDCVYNEQAEEVKRNPQEDSFKEPSVPTKIVEAKSKSMEDDIPKKVPAAEIKTMNTPYIQAIKRKNPVPDEAPYKIQAALEYNTYVLKGLVDQKETLSRSEVDYSLISAWKNLHTLALNADNAAVRGAVVDDTTFLQCAQEEIIKTQKTVIILNKKEQKKTPPYVEIKGFTIIINKDILKL